MRKSVVAIIIVILSVLTMSILASCDGNKSVVGEQNKKEYTVVFYYGMDNEKSKKCVVKEGESAIPPTNEELSIGIVDGVEYVFDGWDKSFDNIVENKDIYAKYIVNGEQKYHTVIFYDSDNILIDEPQKVLSGGMAKVPSSDIMVMPPTISHTYEFVGWVLFDDESNKILNNSIFENVTQDLKVRAYYKESLRKYNVIFQNEFGDIYDTQEVEYGKSAVAPKVDNIETNSHILSFDSWNNEEWKNVQKDTKVVARFKKEVRKFTVSFKVGDSKVSSVEVAYGDILQKESYPKDNLTKPSTPKYNFEFLYWDRENIRIYEDTTINAIFTKSLREYTITLYDNGQIVDIYKTTYGSNIDRKMSKYGYDFDRWYLDKYMTNPLPNPNEIDKIDEDGEKLGQVQGDMSLYANYIQQGLSFKDNEVTGYNGTSKHIDIPRAKDGKPITRICDYFLRGKGFTGSVFVPKNITYIGKSAFAVDNKIIGGGSSNIQVVFEKGVDKSGFAKKSGLFGDVRDNWDFQLDGNKQINDVVDFIVYDDITYLQFDNNVLHIYDFRKESNTRYELNNKININDKEYTINGISNHAFSKVGYLNSIFFPDYTKNWNIGSYIFDNVNTTIFLALSEKGSSWQGNWNSGVGSIRTLWNVLNIIKQGDFEYMVAGDKTAIAISFIGSVDIISGKVTMPNEVTYNEESYIITELHNDLFKNQVTLREIVLPNQLRVIGENTFNNCVLLSKVILPDTLVTIKQQAFMLCTALNSIYLPSSLENVGMFAFMGCPQNMDMKSGRDSAKDYNIINGTGYHPMWNYSVDIADIGKIDPSNIASVINIAKPINVVWGQARA